MTDSRHVFSQIAPGDHVILVYEDAPELYAFIVPYIKNGLTRGDRCLYIAAESRPADLVTVLAAHGIRAEQEAKRTAFAFMTPREYYQVPPLDPLRAVQHLHELLADAVSDGFSGLRVASEMSWAGKTGIPGEVLEEYEALLEKTSGPRRPTMTCIYRRDRFDPEMLERHVRTHGKVVAKDYVFLSLSELFRNLAKTDLQQLARSGHEKTIHKGEVFFRQGEPATEVYFLTAGLVKLVRTDPDGRAVVLRIISPLEPFGDRVLALGDAIRLATAEAMEDSRALVWDGTALRQVMLAHPSILLSALRLMEDRVETDRLRLEDFASPDVRRRLGRLLLRLGQRVGRKTRRGIVVHIPLSRRDLAELTATSPYTVSRILAQWRRQDILDAQRTRIIIRDPERLREIIGDRAAPPAAKSSAS